MNTHKVFGGIVIVLVIIAGVWFFTHQAPSASAPTVSPTPTVSASPTATPNEPVITITSPAANAVVDSPILVTGKAAVFENQLTVEVKDSTGRVVALAPTFTDAKDAGQLGNYTARVEIPPGLATSTMTVEALSYSAKGDGSLAAYKTVPVQLSYTDEMTVYAAFMTADNCSTTTLYPRDITKTTQFVLTSVMELLKGPAPDEVSQGASTDIPSGVVVNSLVENSTTGAVTVDFNGAIDQGLTAGSCQARSITAQIVQTLQHFFGVGTVTITVDGRNDGIL